MRKNNIYDTRFQCPCCFNMTLLSKDKRENKGKVIFHEEFLCEECGSELLAEPRFDDTVKFILYRSGRNMKKVV